MRYVLYRVKHEIEKKIGSLKIKHPKSPENIFFLSLENWRASSNFFIIDLKEKTNFNRLSDNGFKSDSDRILNGEICFFNQEWFNLGLDYNWITNPTNNYKYEPLTHWSEIIDLSDTAGDIKFVWEKSRFSYLLLVIRNDFHNNEDHSEFVFNEIRSWIKHNPINCGPNWKCSQEISLRIINWSFALNFYKDSRHLTDELWNDIQNVIYWSLHHVFKNINFSRIAVRNNHALTETMMLAISDLLFPFIPETKIWSEKGRKWFEQEIDYQIYEDGSFLQFSMNYHRVVIQLLSLGIAVTERGNRPFSHFVYQKAYKSLNFLYQCLQEENGKLPNYGSNDGALFFPLSRTDYRDFRPQLNTLHKLLTGKLLYEDKYISEDSNWISSLVPKKGYKFETLKKQMGCVEFPVGGFYLLREEQTFTLIRCGNHKDRPAHADNLHIDIWKNGVNVLRDSGTYKYNTKKELQDYFTGTCAHNTVTVESYSQMLKGSRFIWYYWSQSLDAKWIEKSDEFEFCGTISAFRFLKSNVLHKRSVRKLKTSDTWIVNDKVLNLPNRVKRQLWHIDDHNLELKAKTDDGTCILAQNAQSYYSDYYGLMKEGKALSFDFENSIETTLNILTP